MKKVLSILLVLCMVMGLVACGNKPTTTNAPTNTTAPTQGGNEPTNAAATPTPVPVEKFEGSFIYKDSVSTLATNWNPHTYQTTDDSYPQDFMVSSLYSLIFNDANHPLEGKDPFTGYVIVPEMAAGEPVDVTEAIKSKYPQFNIPESAKTGYAWEVTLRDDLQFSNGKKITADTFVESVKRVLDPKLINYRATDVFEGTYALANSREYYYQGTTAYLDNGTNHGYTKADLTKKDDGQYYTADGNAMFIGLDFGLAWTGGTTTLKNYVDKYGSDYFDVTNWDTLIAKIDDNGLIPLTDENYELFLPVVTGNDAWGETEADAFNYFVEGKAYPANYDFSNVGLFKTADNKIVYVFNNALEGFYLKIYALTNNWLVDPELYDSCLKETETASGSVWSSTYGTSVETTVSYGPYIMTDYQLDKSMHFVQNEKWYGWTDGEHVYVDPTDKKTYPMYQTTEIDTQVVAESATRKQMFLAGKLMGYGLTADDVTEYRNSEFCHSTPGSTIFFAIFNGYVDTIEKREAAEDFDTTKLDLQSMTLEKFRKAIAVTFDRDLFCASVSPARVPGYGLIGNTYIYDPETCAYYRDTPQAMQALCDFYSVDTSKYASLKDAVASITGYDPETAKTLYQQAYTEAIEKGYITDADGDGKSDQTVTITYSISTDSDFMTKTINYMNEKIGEATVGTGYEGKIQIVKSAPCGNDWSNNIRNGIYDMVLGGWSGSAMDPFGLTDLYVNPDRAYDGKWFDGTSVEMTVNVNGKDLTMTLKEWSDALNGTMVTKDGVDYNFGYGVADVETRLNILAKFEGVVLGTYDYIPMMNNGSMALLSQQVYYVVDEYNPVLSRGGIRYMKYNYDDKEWKDYVAAQGGTLNY
jgi:oligopeptide transport system substrate-binding protein